MKVGVNHSFLVTLQVPYERLQLFERVGVRNALHWAVERKQMFYSSRTILSLTAVAPWDAAEQ